MEYSICRLDEQADRSKKDIFFVCAVHILLAQLVMISLLYLI